MLRGTISHLAHLRASIEVYDEALFIRTGCSHYKFWTANATTNPRVRFDNLVHITAFSAKPYLEPSRQIFLVKFQKEEDEHMLEVSAPNDLSFNQVWGFGISAWLKRSASKNLERVSSTGVLTFVAKAAFRAACINVVKLCREADHALIPVESEGQAAELRVFSELDNVIFDIGGELTKTEEEKESKDCGVMQVARSAAVDMELTIENNIGIRLHRMSKVARGAVI